MIFEADLVLTNLPAFVRQYEITAEELAYLLEMDREGRGQEAIDILMEEYIYEPGKEYQMLIQRYMGMAEDDQLEPSAQDKLTNHISLLSVALLGVLLYNFTKFMNRIYTKRILKEAGITIPDLKNQISKEVISRYKDVVTNMMAQTQTFVNNGIRKLQREIATQRAYVKNMGISGKRLKEEMTAFRKSLRLKYPDLYKAIDSGSILAARKFDKNGEAVRHYKLDSYLDTVSRSVMLDVERTSNTIAARVNSEKVVEFYMADPRSVKKDREICKHILASKVFGKSILALDPETAKMLDIMTVDEAMSTPDFAFGPYCRHSVRRLDSDYLKQIDEVLKGAA